MADGFDSLYLLTFLSAAVGLALLERSPLRRQPVQMRSRWSSNLGLFLIGNVIAGVVLPAGLYAFAQQQPPGLMARLGLPAGLQIVVTFLLLDLWRYAEHRVLHRLPLLWRLHLVHHSDVQVDVTTTERHHPLETVLSTVLLLALVAALGLPAAGVAVYLLTATVVALLSHANVRPPGGRLGRLVGALVVTPAVHAVHHANRLPYTDSNYGAVLTVWDRLFGTYADPDAADVRQHGLEYFHRPADSGLLSVLSQPFRYHRNLAAGEPVAASPGRLRWWAAAPRGTLLATAGGCALTLTVLWPTVSDLAATWSRSEAYQYAWLVLPVLAYVLGWQQQTALRPGELRPAFSGVLLAIAAAVCWVAAASMNLDVGRQLALVLALHGVALAALGMRGYQQAFPALALLFLTVPSGDLLQPALRVLTVKAAELAAVLGGLSYTVDGFVIAIEGRRYVIVDECAGLAYVTLGMFLGHAFGLLLYRSVGRIAALVVLGACLGVGCNALRVAAIVLVDAWSGTQMDLAAHGTAQWAALSVLLVVLLAVLGLLAARGARAARRADVQRLSSADADPLMTSIAAAPARPLRRLAPLLAGLSVLLIAGNADKVLADEAPRPSPSWQARPVPKMPSGWKLAGAPVWSVDLAASTASAVLTYAQGERTLQVVVVETTTPAAKLPDARRAGLDAQRWLEAGFEQTTACASADCLALLRTTWQRNRGRQTQQVYANYGIGPAFNTDSRLTLRVAHGWQRLTGHIGNPRSIAVVSDGGALPADELVAAFRALQRW